MHLALFLVFGIVCVAGAVNLLIQSHPIQSALSLIVVMASLAVEYLLLGLPSLLLVGALLTWSVTHHATVAVSVGSLYGDPRTIGKLLFSQYLLPFEITSLLILIAIMGAVVLASKPEVTPVGLDSGLASGKEN